MITLTVATVAVFGWSAGMVFGVAVAAPFYVYNYLLYKDNASEINLEDIK